MLVYFLCLLLPALLSPKLLMVIEFSRHGAREPIYDFLNTKAFDSKGELTPVGMKQHYLLGHALRSLYIDSLNLLSPSYDPREIYVRSTNYNRTILSANCQMMGLYPPGTGPKVPGNMEEKLLEPPFLSVDEKNAGKLIGRIEEQLQDLALLNGFQPVPVHVFALDQDNLLRPFDLTVCPYNVNLQNLQYTSKTFKDWTDMFKDNTFKELSRILNIPYDEISLWTVFDIYDVHQNFVYAGLEEPVKFNKELFRNMTFIHNIMVHFVYFGSEMQKRLLNTPIFNEIIRYFDGKINKTEQLKFVYYSGHDRTISMILSGLNYSSPECIFEKYMGIKSNRTKDLCLEFAEYAANILIELHENDAGVPEVMLRYNGTYLPMCGNSSSLRCNYNLFRSKLQNYTMPDFAKQCKKDIELINKTLENEEKTSSLERSSVAKVFAFLFGLILGVSVVAGVVYYKFYKQHAEGAQRDSGYMEF